MEIQVSPVPQVGLAVGEKYIATVVSAAVVPSKFDASGRQIELTLSIQLGGRTHPVRDWVGISSPKLLPVMSILTGRSGHYTVQLQSLLGRQAILEIGSKVCRDGKTRLRIARWHPLPAETAPTPAAGAETIEVNQAPA